MLSRYRTDGAGSKPPGAGSEPPETESEPAEPESKPPGAESEPPETESEPAETESEPAEPESKPPGAESEPPAVSPEPPETESEPAEPASKPQGTESERPAVSSERPAARPSLHSLEYLSRTAAVKAGEDFIPGNQPKPPSALRQDASIFISSPSVHSPETSAPRLAATLRTYIASVTLRTSLRSGSTFPGSASRSMARMSVSEYSAP